MDNIEVATAVVKADSLDEVFAAVRDGLQKVRATGAALLHHALDVGDLLNIAQEHIKCTGGSWQRALREHCFLSVRSAFVYQQLARHRTEIEEAIQHAGQLSLRAALRLISTPKKTKKTSDTTQQEVTLTAHWHRESVEGRAAFLDDIGIDEFLSAMSPAFGRELRARVPAEKFNKRMSRDAEKDR